MDVLALLKKEHDEAKALFKRIEEARGDEALTLWRRLRDELTMHEKMEETHFYPELKKEPRAEDLILEGYQEHHVLDLLKGEIDKLDPSNEEWHPKVKVLQENTEHHIKEEEEELFPKVRKIWDTARMEEVGKKMEEMKRREMPGQRKAA